VTVDGNISPGEWADATVVDITCKAGAQPVTAYVKNNESFLAVAVDDPNDTVDILGSEIRIGFDEDNDGSWPGPPCPTEEGVFMVASPVRCVMLSSCTAFGSYATGIGICPPVLPAPGVVADMSWVSGHAQWEAKIDLVASDLNASPGQTIGLYLLGRDQDYVHPNGEWPCGLMEAGNQVVFEEYGDFVLAQPPQEEFVPEAGPILLLGSGLAGLAGYATLRWRTRE
jgi:hypothetical protein